MLAVLNARSDRHNSCEDSVFTTETEEYICGGIFDGCSRGIKSHWASQTYAYLFSPYQDVTHDSCIYTVLSKLVVIASTCRLNSAHLESTCLLFHYDKKTKQLRIRPFGDGYYYVNEVEYAIEQNNQPDYIANHLSDSRFLNDYLAKYPVHTYEDVKRFMICSDGIKQINKSQFREYTIDANELLFTSPNSANYLQRMFNRIKKDGYVIDDDLTIVSYDAI